jgi:hypothetical protein
MIQIGRNLLPEIEPKSILPPLSILEKMKKRYFDYQIKRCNKKAERYGKSAAGVDMILWNATVSRRASYYYRTQALYLTAELRELSKYGQ